MNERFNYTNNNRARRANIFIYLASAILIIGVLVYIFKALFLVRAQKNPFVGKNMHKSMAANEEVCSRIRTIVIDPGHGGKDGGTKGQYSLEKENTLAIGLKLGAIIKKYHPYIKVIYTRTTDVFVSLEDRVDIANTNDADLFISIHCNSDGVHTIKHTRKAKRRAYFSKYIKYSTKTNGTETYILDNDYLLEENIINTNNKYMLGLQSNNNMPVNNSYLLPGYSHGEEDPEPDPLEVFRTLTGLGRIYNPLAIELEYERLKKSYQVARLIEAEFASIGRKSRGVHESHFLVLRETIMPAVLIETGFITNIHEEAYLHSDQGRKETAFSIYNAISKYIEFVKSSI